MEEHKEGQSQQGESERERVCDRAVGEDGGRETRRGSGRGRQERKVVKLKQEKRDRKMNTSGLIASS